MWAEFTQVPFLKQLVLWPQINYLTYSISAWSVVEWKQPFCVFLPFSLSFSFFLSFTEGKRQSERHYSIKVPLSAMGSGSSENNLTWLLCQENVRYSIVVVDSAISLIKFKSHQKYNAVASPLLKYNLLVCLESHCGWVSAENHNPFPTLCTDDYISLA